MKPYPERRQPRRFFRSLACLAGVIFCADLAAARSPAAAAPPARRNNPAAAKGRNAPAPPPAPGFVIGKTHSVIELELLGRGEDGAPTVNLFGLPLYREIIFRGKIAGIDGAGLHFRKGQWRSEQLDSGSGAYYLEILGGPHRGFLTNLASVDEESMILTTADDLSTLLKPNNRVRIGKHRTLFSVFGADNRFGLKAGRTSDEADDLILFDAPRQTPEVYFFSSAVSGWVNAREPQRPGGDVILYPGQGILLRRRGANAIRLAVTGPLVEEPFSLPVEPGVNIMSDVQYGTHREGDYLVRSRRPRPVNRPPLKRAVEVPALARAPAPNGRYRFVEDAALSWIDAVGLQPDERLNVVNGSAYILKEPENASPYFLSTDETE